MSHTLSVRLPEDLAVWLQEAAENSGLSQGQIVRDQLVSAKEAAANRAFMRWAGAVDGPKDLSSRKGFSRK